MYRLKTSVCLLLSLLQAAYVLGTTEPKRQATVRSGSMFRVEVIQRTRLRKDRPIKARLLDPIYSENTLLIPRGTIIQGKIAKVLPSPRKKRLDAKFHGDFTPLSEPVIQWTALARPDGTGYSLSAESAGAAGSTLYFRSARKPHASLIRHLWASLLERKNAALNTVIAPQKWERLQKYLWSQLPYHPQYVDQGTEYEMALTRDLRVAIESRAVPASLNTQPIEQVISVRSRLRTELDSGSAKAGDPVEAVVTEPVMNAQHKLLVPQNSILHGRVLRAVPSGRFGRNGVLRFAFDEITYPSGYHQNVEANPTAVEGRSDAKLSVDEEGGVARKANRAIAAPGIMGVLAASALSDEDAGIGTRALSSNGFALVGRLAAIGISSPYVGGTIGAVGTGRSVYTHWLAHGKETHFGSDTEVVLEVSPSHARRMNPVQ